MSTFYRCPGSLRTTNPTPNDIKCPKCQKEVEIWSDEMRVKCHNCGNTVTQKTLPSCVAWCPAAKMCMGDLINVDEIKEKAMATISEKEAAEHFMKKLKDWIEKNKAAKQKDEGEK